MFAVFFTTVAGAFSALLGLIEGLADFSASSLNYLAGWLSAGSFGIAQTDVVPGLVRRAMSKFFGNIVDAWSAINLALQGRFKLGLERTMQFAINSTFGLVALIDIATETGIDRRGEDLDKT